MNLKEFEQGAFKTDKGHYPLTSEQATVVDNALGLSGECGEVVDLVKHAIFHNENPDKFKLAKELGDVMWYLVHIAKDHGIPMEVVLELNNKKLSQRYPKGYDDRASRERHKIEANAQLQIDFTDIMHIHGGTL